MPTPTDVHIFELRIFVQAGKLKSLREVARQEGLKPAHISKSIKRLEQKIGVKLLKRSSSGIILTPEGLDLIKTAEEICNLADKLRPPGERLPDEKVHKIWSIGSISFLASCLIAPAVSNFEKSTPLTSFRLVEFTHNELIGHGINGAFEMAVHIEPLEWTRLWVSDEIGKLQWKLFGRANHPLGKKTTESAVLKYSFITPTDWTTLGYAEGDDHCPVGVRQRRRGHEAATAETALQIVKATDQLTFVPEILVERSRQAGLMEIKVKDWPVVSKGIYLSVKSDVVPQSLLKMMLATLRERLN